MPTNQNVVVPKNLIDSLATTHVPVERVKWVFDWLADNPSHVEEFSEYIHKLDYRGRRRMCHALARRRTPKSADPLKCAKRALQFVDGLKRMREVRERFQKRPTEKLTLANGLECLVSTDTRGWSAIFNYDKYRIKLLLWTGQIVSLERRATRSSSILKRMRPMAIEVYGEKKWQPLPPNCFPAIMQALAEKLPIPVALLLA